MPSESKKSNRLNWIDLFNIGNVMLMRGQDIQVSHLGISEICELDDATKINENVVEDTEKAASSASKPK